MRGKRVFSTETSPFTAIDGGTYLGWGNFLIQLGNFIVIVVMLVIFGLALALPFPGTKRSK
ncbi:MAG: hypothetical protein JWM49_1631 [Microbacteriaceae bacterium]|jgi:hypothetical protein|nr:hypothetical protein [Microbacteriaceae bacterium]